MSLIANMALANLSSSVMPDFSSNFFILSVNSPIGTTIGYLGSVDLFTLTSLSLLSIISFALVSILLLSELLPSAFTLLLDVSLSLSLYFLPFKFDFSIGILS